LDQLNNVGNLVTRSQYSLSAGSGVATDALCATYSNIPQHAVFIDLSRNGINTGLSLVDEPLIIQNILSVNALYNGAGRAGNLFMDVFIGYSIVVELLGYQHASVGSV
jgi:hypothetical protein